MKNTEKSNQEWVWLLVVGSIVFLFWAFYSYLLKGDPARGTYGDMFGGINALFSGWAFACLIYTVFLQSKELRLQREELEETRNVLKEQTSQAELQNSVLLIQQFENTFFQLLRLHNDLVNSMDLGSGNPKRIIGRDCFNTFHSNMIRGFNDMRSKRNVNVLNKNYKNDISLINEAYEKFYSRYSSDLGHYFRMLYNILKFVDRSNASDKRLYTNLIRAQLSDRELNIIFYDGLSKYGSLKFKPLIEKYGLLKSMDVKHLSNEADIEHYSENAFI